MKRDHVLDLVSLDPVLFFYSDGPSCFRCGVSIAANSNSRLSWLLQVSLAAGTGCSRGYEVKVSGLTSSTAPV